MKSPIPFALKCLLPIKLSGLLIIAEGCGDRNSPAPAAASPPTTSAATQPNGRLTAALAIRDVLKRDDAATAAALTLAKIGKHNDAPTLALLISDTIKRDDTLSKLAGK